MEIKMTAKHKNILIGALLLFALLGSVYSIYVGQSRNPQFIADSQNYKQMDKLSQAGKFAEAEALAANLVNAYPNSYFVHWKYGKILNSLNKYAEAKEQFALIQQIHPAIVLRPGYLFDYGRILMRLNQDKEAQRYLQAAKQLATNEKDKAAVEQLITQVIAKQQN